MHSRAPRAPFSAAGVLALLALVSMPAGAARAEGVAPVSSASGAAVGSAALGGYKPGETWPLTNFHGLDLTEPLFPTVAARRGDWGRVALSSALPYALLVSAFAFKSEDPGTLAEIDRWHWAGVDDSQDNYPFLYGLVGLSTVSALLPATGPGAGGTSWRLRLDRLTVLGIGIGVANLEVELLKPVFHRHRPGGSASTASRPSGHAATAFAAMAFCSDVLRDWLRPEDQPDLLLRIGEELATAVPYLGAGYMALERVHHRKHFLTDTLLGGALGAFTMHMLYEWSFLRAGGGGAWPGLSLAYAPVDGGFEVALRGRF